MTLAELHHELTERGIELRRTDTGLQARPTAAVDETIRAAIREQREMLLLLCDIEAARADRIWDLDYFLSAFPGDVEAALLGAWFWTYAHTLPTQPFELEEGRTVTNPMAFYREIAWAVSYTEEPGELAETKRVLELLLGLSQRAK